MSSDTHRTNGEQFAAMGYHASSAYASHQQQQQQHPGSGYPDFSARPVFNSQRNISSGTQQPVGQSRSGSSALGILADVALAGGGIPNFSTTQPNVPQTTTGHVQPRGTSTTMSMNMNTHPPVSHSTGLPPAMYFTPPATAEYTQNRSANPATVPGNTYPWTPLTSTIIGSSPFAHPPNHNNQLPSIFETAAGLRSFAMSGASSIRPRCVNRTITGSESRPSSFSSAAVKKKSSYIIEQMEKVDKVEKDSVGRVRDRTNYFAYSQAQADTVTSAGDSEDDTHDDEGKEKGAVKSERESTRDRPGDKYVRMFQGPEQQRYEEAMLEILDGMELPRSSDQ
ncbi:uncharacterized protein TRUGW13939_10086 [Talaromyces rugulosus]|uniref:Uncharacterized protein n=1 Tax=Talaromyces rugulosus TaxID=121627 RepID=A0A7H8RAC9_TALRU|nr:uncharacterized protein TRUGW13939_10086 [Talaromyces rugulosus]QKX62918.1 hypothetical protein TRUGW13939_10086 [Talaromyces rugulosus]